MFKSKKLSLLMALVFAFTVIMPVGAAFAASEPTVSSTTTTVNEDDAQALGYIKIDNDDMSTVNEVYLDIDLPDDVEFNYTDYADEETLLNYVIDDLPAGATVSFDDYDADEFSAVIDLTGAADKDQDLYIKFIDDSDNGLVNIDKSADDDIMVTLDARATSEFGGTAWEINDKDYKLATKATGDITATVASPKSIKMGDNKEVAKITIEEAYAGQFDADEPDTITLELTSDDFAWDSISIDGKYGLDASVSDTSDDQEWELEIDTESSKFAGSLELTGYVTAFPSADEGDVDVSVNSSNSDFDSDNFTVATFGSSDVTVTADEDTGMEDYMRKANIGELWELTFETSGTFTEGDDIVIDLPDGFKFVTDEDWPSALGSPNDMSAAGTGVYGGDVDSKGSFDSDQSLWLKVGSAADGEDEMTINGLWVASMPDVENGDIEIEISGDVVETTVVAGYVKPSFTVEVEPTDVEIGLAEVAGDISFTETDKDALSDGLYFYAELPSGVTFAQTPTVEVNGDELDDVSIDFTVANSVRPSGESKDYNEDDTLRFELDGLSDSKVDTITIKDIEYAVDDRYQPGETIAMAFGGIELQDNLNNLWFDEDNNIGYGANDQFEDEYDDNVFEVPNAVVKDKDIVTATFTLGEEGVVVKNGRTLAQVNMLTETLGLQKSWDAANKTAYFVKDGKVVAFPIGENAIYINGTKLPVDQGGVIIDGATYASLKGIQMAFGGKLTWNNTTKTATFEF